VTDGVGDRIAEARRDQAGRAQRGLALGALAVEEERARQEQPRQRVRRIQVHGAPGERDGGGEVTVVEDHPVQFERRRGIAGHGRERLLPVAPGGLAVALFGAHATQPQEGTHQRPVDRDGPFERAPRGREQPHGREPDPGVPMHAGVVRRERACPFVKRARGTRPPGEPLEGGQVHGGVQTVGSVGQALAIEGPRLVPLALPVRVHRAGETGGRDLARRVPGRALLRAPRLGPSRRQRGQLTSWAPPRTRRAACGFHMRFGVHAAPAGQRPWITQAPHDGVPGPEAACVKEER
jgi:hypothetical protein